MKCKECDKKLRSDNSVGYCAKHRNLAPSVIAYKDQYYNDNKDRLNADKLENYYANKPVLGERNCKHCGTEFKPTRTDNEFCQDACGQAFWRSNNKEYIKQDQTRRYHEDIDRKISTCLRSRLNKALKGNVKSAATMKLLGCSIDQLKQHLESQFEPWMNWDNHSRYHPNKRTWQIDHIKPFFLFDLSSPAQQQEACNYKNLRPLLAKNNLVKGKKG